MAVDFSALSAYVDQVSGKLIKKALLTDRTVQTGITIQTGIKSQESINILSGTLIGQATNCGISPTGSVALTQRNIVVCPITVFEDTCAPAFDAYWTQILNPAGSYYDKNPIEQIYVEQKVNAISKLSGELLWRGDTAGYPYTGLTTSAVTGNITLCNGILHDLEKVSGSASVITTTSNGTTFTTGTALATLNAIIDASLSSASDMLMRNDKNIYMSYAYFNILRQALVTANLYHYDGNPNDGRMEFTFMDYLGTGFNVIATQGLYGTSRIVCTYAENIVLGVDLENDQDKIEVFYDKRLDTVYFRSKWKQGAKVAFPELVVLFNGYTI